MLDKRSEGIHPGGGDEGIPGADTDIPPMDEGSEKLPF
jgi:hypothetical protein